MAISLKDEDVYVFDIEADALLDDVTKIHCLSVGRLNKEGEFKVKTFTEYEDMVNFFLDETITKVGHNIILYDIPAAEKVLGIKISTDNVIDTLPLSWILFPHLLVHGLEEWGKAFGIKKPEIKSFIGLGDDDLEIIKYFEDIYTKESINETQGDITA
jgi:DNA polymerase III alpha subunit (gram-positive type)